MESDHLVPGGVAAQEFNRVAGAIEGFGKQAEERFVGRGVDRRGCDLDAKFDAKRADDCIGGSAGLKLDREQEAIRLDAQEGGSGAFVFQSKKPRKR